MKTKPLLIAGLLLLLVPFASAEIIPTIKDIVPTNNNLNRDTRITVEIRNNGTSTENFNVSARLRLPNGTLRPEDAADKNKEGTVKGEEDQDVVFQLRQERFTSFGRYTFLVNETMHGRSDRFRYQIIPAPIVDLNAENLDVDLSDSIGSLVLSLDIQGLDLQTGDPLFDELVEKNLTLFNVSSSGETQEVAVFPLRENNDTEVLFANISEDRFDPGCYQVLARFTVLGGKFNNYTQKKQESFCVKAENDAMELSLLLAPFLAAFFMIWFGNQWGDDNSSEEAKRWAQPIKLLMYMAGFIFTMAGVFIGSLLATNSALYTNFATTLNAVLLALIVLFVFMLLILLVWYVKNSLETSMASAEPESPMG